MLDCRERVVVVQQKSTAVEQRSRIAARKLFADLRQEIGPQEDHGFQLLGIHGLQENDLSRSHPKMWLKGGESHPNCPKNSSLANFSKLPANWCVLDWVVLNDDEQMINSIWM